MEKCQHSPFEGWNFIISRSWVEFETADMCWSLPHGNRFGAMGQFAHFRVTQWNCGPRCSTPGGLNEVLPLIH